MTQSPQFSTRPPVPQETKPQANAAERKVAELEKRLEACEAKLRRMSKQFGLEY